LLLTIFALKGGSLCPSHQVADIFPSILNEPAPESADMAINLVLSKLAHMFFSSTENNLTTFTKAMRVATDVDKLLKSGSRLPDTAAKVLSSAVQVSSLLALRPKYTLHALSEFCFANEAPLKASFPESSPWHRISNFPKEFADDAIAVDSRLATSSQWVSAWTALLKATTSIDVDATTASDYRAFLKVGKGNTFVNTSARNSFADSCVALGKITLPASVCN
jgi:hypothetical protein